MRQSEVPPRISYTESRGSHAKKEFKKLAESSETKEAYDETFGKLTAFRNDLNKVSARDVSQIFQVCEDDLFVRTDIEFKGIPWMDVICRRTLFPPPQRGHPFPFSASAYAIPFSLHCNHNVLYLLHGNCMRELALYSVSFSIKNKNSKKSALDAENEYQRLLQTEGGAGAEALMCDHLKEVEGELDAPDLNIYSKNNKNLGQWGDAPKKINFQLVLLKLGHKNSQILLPLLFEYLDKPTDWKQADKYNVYDWRFVWRKIAQHTLLAEGGKVLTDREIKRLEALWDYAKSTTTREINHTAFLLNIHNMVYALVREYGLYSDHLGCMVNSMPTTLKLGGEFLDLCAYRCHNPLPDHPAVREASEGILGRHGLNFPLTEICIYEYRPVGSAELREGARQYHYTERPLGILIILNGRRLTPTKENLRLFVRMMEELKEANRKNRLGLQGFANKSPHTALKNFTLAKENAGALSEISLKS